MHQNRQIKQLISQTVPEPVAEHVLFCRLDNGRLRITVDEAGWIVKLRFLKSQLIDTLSEHQFRVDSISFHVDPRAAAISEVRKAPPERENLNDGHAKNVQAERLRTVPTAAEQTEVNSADSFDRELDRFIGNARRAKRTPG